MSPFALVAPPSVRSGELVILVQIAFVLYTLGSFIRVLAYASGEFRAGGMTDNPRAPLPLKVSGIAGWLFIISVLGLLYVQSWLYLPLIVVGVSAFLIESGRTAREQFGLARVRAGLLLQWSLLVCGAVIFIELPLSQLVDWLMNAIHLPHPEQENVVIFRSFRQPGEIFSFLVQAVLISPLIEEIFFRGFLLSFLKNYTSTWLAIVLSAGVFAFVHLNLGSVIQLWLLGIVLGVAYENGGSLLLPFGIHAFFNLFTALSLLLDKGGF
jgi:membrane protease YdiL (CAAX protease family)